MVEAKSATDKPSLCDSGHVLVVSHSYPPVASGSSVVIRNLLHGFAPASYTVATCGTQQQRAAIAENSQARVKRIVPANPGPARLNLYWLDLLGPLLIRRLKSLCRQSEPSVILAVYPEFHFFQAACRVADSLDIPLVAYLHDTLTEALSRGRLRNRAKKLEARVFDRAARVLVMSEGMSDLYRHKHNHEFQPLVHAYLEPITNEPAESTSTQAFWSGAIYAINVNAVRRVSASLERTGRQFHLTTKVPRSTLARLGISGDHISTHFYAGRAAYLAAMQQQGVLILAIDFPDESPVHEDELATIFPTKTPEYLASGRPIVVHCPQHYFLAKYFQDRDAGIVVSDRDPAALDEAFTALKDNPARARELGVNALRSAKEFAYGPVSSTLSTVLNSVVREDHRSRR